MQVKAKYVPGKSRGGTIVARKMMDVKKGGTAKGKLLFQTRSQLDVHLLNKNGQQRK